MRRRGRNKVTETVVWMPHKDISTIQKLDKLSRLLEHYRRELEQNPNDVELHNKIRELRDQSQKIMRK
jgi:hypothetical protein